MFQYEWKQHRLQAFELQNLSAHPYPFEYKFSKPRMFPSGSSRFQICDAALPLQRILDCTWNIFHFLSADARSTDNHRTTSLLLRNSYHIFHKERILPSL